MSRTHYRNGDPIGTQGLPCDSCEPSVINGVLCHEHGCPDAWRDYERSCDACGFDYLPAEAYERMCPECAEDLERYEHGEDGL